MRRMKYRSLCIGRHEGQKENVELLIANGADVNLRSGMVVKTKDGSDGEQMAQK